MLTKASIRWTIRRDLEQIMAIEAQAFGSPWSEAEMVAVLRTAHMTSLVATTPQWTPQVAGFLIYETRRGSHQIINLAVRKDLRRKGYGTALIDRVKAHTNRMPRPIEAMVSDRNLRAHLFLRHNNFNATTVIKDAYNHNSEPQDAYRFEYSPLKRATLTTDKRVH